MSKRKSSARPRRNERLEDRQMLAADLGVELSSLSDLEAETVVTASVDATESTLNGDNTAGTELLGLDGVVDQDSDVVLGWNDLFGELLVNDVSNQNPGYASRSMAMLNLAIYDAVTLSTGDPDDTFYDYGRLGVDGRVSAELVASMAAYTVLSELYPDEQAAIDSYLDAVLAGSDQSNVTAASLELGTEIGNTVIEARENDGSDVVVDYEFSDSDEAGSFQADPLNPDVPVWGPAWGEVETFAISSAESFAPETTPALGSQEYTDSYNEVYELGSVDSTVRTADETEAGIFWAYDREGLGTPLALFSDVLETIAVQEGNSLEENAALYAQASVAMADAAIVAWQTKFDEEFWRPVTAIQSGDTDGNDLTEGDEDWTALGAPDGGDDIIGFTPQFPTYISGHATFGGALFGSLQDFYGTDDIAFELDSAELEILLEDPDLQEAYGLDLDDATRSFDSFSEAMAENGRSRVYLGIHFDFDDLVGQEVGQSVAAAVSSEFVVASDDTIAGNEDRGPRVDGQAGNNQRGPGDQNGPKNQVGGQQVGGPDQRNDAGPGGGPTGVAIGGTGQGAGQQRLDAPDPRDQAPIAQAGDTLNGPAATPNRTLVVGANGLGNNTQPGRTAVEENDNQRTDTNRAVAEDENDRQRDSLLASEELSDSTDAVDAVFSELGESDLVIPLDQQVAARQTQDRRRG